ncbi:MAG: hypothetical protein JWM33_2522 [Caulobacteraceae bacterium]|nr:hypothetical protein [Caulobacteraceae bacterium]
MAGNLLPVWPNAWKEIWLPLAAHKATPADLWSTLYVELVSRPRGPGQPPLLTEFDPSGEPNNSDEIEKWEEFQADVVSYQRELAEYEEAAAIPRVAKLALRRVLLGINTESGVRGVLKDGFDAVGEYSDETLGNRYFNLVDSFFDRFNLRYDLRRPFSIQPTPVGVYAKLFEEIVDVCLKDEALFALLRDYREAFQDLSQGATSGRINTCLQKQVNLLEGLTSMTDGVSEKTLGKMCGEVKSWPSTAVSEAAKAMYGFASDHTGLRHGTIKKAKEGKTPVVHRDMEMRDLVAVSAFFTGMAAYLSDRISPSAAYGL